MSDLRYFGTFPFCPRIIESEDEIETIDEEVAQRWVDNLAAGEASIPRIIRPTEYKGYYGSLYPFKMDLSEAMWFFWRLKSIEFDFVWEFRETVGEFFSRTWTNDTDASWKDDLEINNEEDLFMQRVCNEKNPLVWKTRVTQSSPPVSIVFSGDYHIRCFDSAVGGGISEFSVRSYGFNFEPILNDADQMLALFKGGDDNNPNNYWYYPMFRFEASGDAGGGVSSFGPLWEYEERIQTRPERRIEYSNSVFESYFTTINGNSLFFETNSIELFVIQLCSRYTLLPDNLEKVCGFSGGPAGPPFLVPRQPTIDGGFNVVTFDD